MTLLRTLFIPSLRVLQSRPGRSVLSRAFTMKSIDAARATIVDTVRFDILTATQDEVISGTLKYGDAKKLTHVNPVPTPEMYIYAARASVGDDVYNEPSTHALEAHVARITGKEAGLFVPSGTMSNQIALRTHLRQPPYSVLCDHRAHIIKYEAGGAAFHSGATTISVVPSNEHHLALSDIQNHIELTADFHCAPTEVVALENTLNGTIIPQEEVVAISDWVHSNGVKMHLDGARLWHVAIETGTPLKELCDPFDSVSLCFSKGLGAPIGSCLVGSAEFIRKARWFRKLFGAGMRQTGILAASAAYALTHNFPLLSDVHALARRLEAGLEEIGVRITSPAETCMIFFDPSPIGVDYEELVERADKLPNPIRLGGSRLVVHIQTSTEAVDDLLALVRQLAEEKKAAGFVYDHEPNGRLQNGIYVRGVRKQK